MSLRPGLRKHNLTLNVECQPNLMMNTYPGPYGQVLTNLFLNSVGARLPGRQAGTDRHPGSGGRQGQCRDSAFADNGIGMSLDVRRRAFDPFFTTRRDQGGTGLGLHIVYSIVTTASAAASTSIPSRRRARGSRCSCRACAPLEQAAE